MIPRFCGAFRVNGDCDNSFIWGGSCRYFDLIKVMEEGSNELDWCET